MSVKSKVLPTITSRIEAETLLTLPPHPNLANYMEVVSTDDHKMTLTSQIVPGRQLDKLAKLTIADALSAIRQLMGAIQHLHLHHLTHRDVKPANIIMHSSRFVLVDIGLSGTKSFPSARQSGWQRGRIVENRIHTEQDISFAQWQASDCYGVVMSVLSVFCPTAIPAEALLAQGSLQQVYAEIRQKLTAPRCNCKGDVGVLLELVHLVLTGAMEDQPVTAKDCLQLLQVEFMV